MSIFTSWTSSYQFCSGVANSLLSCNFFSEKKTTSIPFLERIGKAAEQVYSASRQCGASDFENQTLTKISDIGGAVVDQFKVDWSSLNEAHIQMNVGQIEAEGLNLTDLNCNASLECMDENLMEFHSASHFFIESLKYNLRFSNDTILCDLQQTSTTEEQDSSWPFVVTTCVISLIGLGLLGTSVYFVVRKMKKQDNTQNFDRLVKGF